MISNQIGEYHPDNIFLQDLEEMVCRFTPDGTITYVNAREAHLLNHKPSELLGQKISKYIMEKSVSLLNDVLNTLSSKYPTQEYEHQYTSPGGKPQWQLWKVRGRFNSDGQLEEVQAVGRDISIKKQYQGLLDNYQQDLEKELAASTHQLQREIIERQENDEAIRESEAKFRKLTEMAPGIICVIQGSKFRYTNPAFQNLLGYDQEDLLNLNFGDTIHPEHRDMVVERTIARLRGELVPNRYEIKLLTKNGSEIWIDLTVGLIDYEGKPAIIAMANDITASHQLQKAWQKSENTFRQLSDTAPALIFIIQKYRYRYVNNFFKSRMGYTEEELLTLYSLGLVHPDFRELVMDGLAELENGNSQLFRTDIKIIPKSGQVCWIDFSASILAWEGRLAVIAVGYDITHHKDIQAALTQSEMNFRSLADTAPALIYVLRGSQLLYTNKAFEDITGYSREECLQMEAWDFIHPQYQEWVRETSLARQRGEAVPSRYQARMQRKDDRETWAEFSVSHIIFNGEPAILGVAIDITKQKKAQDQIKYLSYHDKLTGLYNRAYLEEKIKELDDDQNLPLSLIIGDVNGLKLVNDAFGHQYGDLLLQNVANILTSCCRQKDLIARWGGDEFVIILPRSYEDKARQVCQKIYESCAELNKFPIQVSIALGVACKAGPGKSMETIYKEAEDLMYRNKLLENRSNRSAFLSSLEQTLWVRSHETQEHTLRLRRLVVIIGGALPLPLDELNNLDLLAALHDIGKIAIPNSILDKPERLSTDEWDLMKRHPEIGYRIALSSPELSPIADAILAHHERWDGSGYPLGMKDNDIPLISRILSLADAYDVMISGRPYQKEIGSKEALQEILQCAGSQFDPHLAKLFVNVVSSMQSNLA